MALPDSYWKLGDDQYTCVSPPGYEKDPAVTAAIHVFDPGMIPIWRVQLWRFPGSTEVTRVVHHGIGRYYPVPRYIRKPFRVELPADAHSEPPNFLDAILEDDSTLQYKKGGPGGYIPWDWHLYRWCRGMFDQMTVEKWEDRQRKREDRRQVEIARSLEEIEYKRKQIEPYLMKKAAEISDGDWSRYLEYAWGIGKKDKLKAPKPYVFLGRSPRHEQTYGRVAPAQGVE